MCFNSLNDESKDSSGDKAGKIINQHMGGANCVTVEIQCTENEATHAVTMGTEVRDSCTKPASESREKATANQLMSLLQFQQFRCALTGDKLTPGIARCDHVVPVSEGGSNHIENLQWVTEDINRAKGVMSQDQFIQMCVKVAKWTQRQV